MHHGEDWWWKMNEVHDKILEKLDEIVVRIVSQMIQKVKPEHEITVGNYTTKFFYMCGSAQKVMNANKDKPGVRTFSQECKMISTN